MTNIILFDEKERWTELLPITYTRPVSNIRVGISTLKEKWARYFKKDNFSYYTTDYLNVKFPIIVEEENLFIAGNCCANNELATAIKGLAVNEALVMADGDIIAFRGCMENFEKRNFASEKTFESKINRIKQLYDIFSLNDEELKADYKEITSGRVSQPLSESCTWIGPKETPDGIPSIFIEEGASVEGAFLNTTNGPIYVGKDATIMEGACIRGSFAALENAVVKMGAKVYGATTLGKYCKVGGELSNVVMLGYSNKAHDGYLGNAVIGEWCNLGAGTSASNLKNDYTEIKLWNYRVHRFMRTGLQFCGLIMGDHSKAGINCMFNTATVIGVGVNIHGTGFPRNFVASFSEGGASGYSDVSVAKFFDIAKRVMIRRGIELSDVDRSIFESIYNIADNYK